MVPFLFQTALLYRTDEACLLPSSFPHTAAFALLPDLLPAMLFDEG